MKRIIAYKVGRCIVVKNYAAGKRDRFDTFMLNHDQSKAKRVGCELTLTHSIRIATDRGGAKK